MALAFAESFNGRMRDELLNESLFFGLTRLPTAFPGDVRGRLGKLPE